MNTTKRFVKNGQGQVMDREMHPKVKKAQEEHARNMAKLKDERARQQRQ